MTAVPFSSSDSHVTGSKALPVLSLMLQEADTYGQEEPLLAFKTGKCVYYGHSPTSQPGNGSKESQGKSFRQSEMYLMLPHCAILHLLSLSLERWRNTVSGLRGISLIEEWKKDRETQRERKGAGVSGQVDVTSPAVL
ncbi:hypothetical protein IRJ41_007055 [Triplophysa rosa]|uniref:Uncharacterized protein n=1 Tax=Triplophysa rosa TaxID=992332 RepID=A0A9W7WIT1_TRIRA|nr:hypothetical protein IRJ41_007055 [Triplophysa rosa]